MLEKYSKQTIVALALAIVVVLVVQVWQSTPAYSYSAGTFDQFGIKEIYSTKQGGNEWYVNMDNPRDDSNFRNLDNVKFSKNTDGSWRVYADQIRMEAWSPSNEKWHNVEITEYAKMISGSNELLQMYSRGGHHTSKDPCLGSTYKARLYGNGEAAWNKEITHPAYAGNRGIVQATAAPLKERWVGFKAIIYNIEENGNTYVRLESYIDDDVTDGSGNLIIKNNWKLASVYVDKGGWATHDSDFDSSCGRARGEIMTGPGGTNSQNIAAFRSDDLTWDFKYLSVREIVPQESTLESQPLTEVPEPTLDDSTPILPADSSNDYNMCNASDCVLIAGQHVPNDSLEAVKSVALQLRRLDSAIPEGNVTIAIVQNGRALASYAVDTTSIQQSYTDVVAHFDNSANVSGNNFDILVLYGHGDAIAANRHTNYVSGNLFTAATEYLDYDLDYGIS